MPDKKTLILLLTILSLGSTYTKAQVVFQSINDVWAYADKHNITIRTSQFDLNKSEYSKKNAYSALLPQISANGTATDNTALQTTLIPAEMLGGPAGVYRAVQFGQKYIYSGGYTAQLDIVNLQSWLNVKIANENNEASKDSLSNFRKTIYQQLATQYYSYLLMKEAELLARKSEVIADSVYKSISYKYSEGLVNEANVDLSKMNLDRAKQTLITSQYQILTAKNNLKGLLDLSVNDSLIIDDQLSNNIAIISTDQFQEDPAIKLSLHQANVSLYQYKLANSNFLPTISILYSNATQQNDNKFEPFQGGPQWFPARYWSLKASWMIFNGGGRYFMSKKNKIANEEKIMLYENTIKQTALNDENLKLAYKKSIALLNNSKEVMDLSFNNYSHITNRYNEGIASIEDRLNAFSDYINYQNQYLNNLSDMLVQLYMIKIRQLNFK